jgi:hypothetical protein
MIKIAESGASSVVFRLKRVSRYENYIFELENQNSRELTTFTASDISPAPIIYNEYVWINGGTGSTFDLDSGNYTLRVYESEFNDLNVGSASLFYSNEIKIEGSVPDIVSVDTKINIIYYGN